MDKDREVNLIIKYYIYNIKDEHDTTIREYMDCTTEELSYIKSNYDNLFMKYKNKIFSKLDKYEVPYCKDENLRSELVNLFRLNKINFKMYSRAIRIINISYYKIDKVGFSDDKILLYNIENRVTYKVTPKGLYIYHKLNDERSIKGWFEGCYVYKKISNPLFWRNNLVY